MMKEKLINSAGSISGCASILGSWQICHNICLVLIFALSLIGITVVGMPLQFFTTIAIPMWTIAVILFGITLFLYLRNHCISENIILINYGLIIAGIPFQSLQQFSVFFWIVGGLIAGVGIVLAIKNKLKNKHKRNKMNKLNFNITQKHIMYGLIVVLAILIVVNVASIFNQNGTNAQQVSSIENKIIEPESSKLRTINTGTTEQGEVSISLTPKEMKEGILTISIAANTHSVDLSVFDLKELTVLEFEGKQIKPSSAPKLSGHHASGELIFNVGKELKNFVVKLKGIPKIEERIFEWN